MIYLIYCIITDKPLSVNSKHKRIVKKMTSKSLLVVSAEKVQIKMAEHCMNPYELCSKAGISSPSYQRIIKTGNCKISTLGKIAKALDVPVTDIIQEAIAIADNGN